MLRVSGKFVDGSQREGTTVHVLATCAGKVAPRRLMLVIKDLQRSP